MNGYTKLFQSLLTSSIWSEDDKTRIVWITMLALASRDGIVEASMAGLATLSRVDIDDCRKAVLKLESPDLDSRTSDNEGRRVQKIEGGWKILNHAKYREKMSLENRREYHRLKQQEYRQRVKNIDKSKTLRQVIQEKVQAEEYQERHQE